MKIQWNRAEVIRAICILPLSMTPIAICAQQTSGPDFRILSDHEILIQATDSAHPGPAPVVASSPGSVASAGSVQPVGTINNGIPAGSWYYVSFPAKMFKVGLAVTLQYGFTHRSTGQADSQTLVIKITDSIEASVSWSGIRAQDVCLVQSQVAFGAASDSFARYRQDEQAEIDHCSGADKSSCIPTYVGELRVPASEDNKRCQYFVPTQEIGPNILGSKIKLKFVARPAPTQKKDAAIYANVNLVAASGARFAWGLDGSLDEQYQFKRLIVHYLNATANGGNNTATIKTQNYTDSVCWKLPVTYLLGDSAQSNAFRKYLGVYNLNIAPDYETDFELDRRNFLAGFNANLWLLNHPLQDKVIESNNPKETMSSYIKAHKYAGGDEMDFTPGLEGGGAMADTVQKPSTGSAPSVPIPAYSIFRAAPVMHGELQFRQFSLDETFTARYLFLTENSATQSKANIVYPLRLAGWKAISKCVVSYKPNPDGNLAFTVTYTDGFDAPKFQRTNSVQVGLTFIK
ncbi:MAG: hypothetical protein ACLPXT_01765 [Terracidiphilus sp.]